MYKEFTKSDLKDYMTVETRSGSKYIFISDRLLGEVGYEPIDNYLNNLMHKYVNELDIVKCYEPANKLYSIHDLLYPGKLIFARHENTISYEEAMKVLREHYGYDVKIKE